MQYCPKNIVVTFSNENALVAKFDLAVKKVKFNLRLSLATTQNLVLICIAVS